MVNAFTFSALTPTIPILLTAIPWHTIISLIQWIGYTALLRICHGHFWWDALPFCHDWLNNTFRVLGLWTYMNPWRYTVFSTDGFRGATNFKYVCSGFLCCVCSLNSLSSWLLLWFLIYGLVQVLFLSLVVKF
jgi:hypothetical protein